MKARRHIFEPFEHLFETMRADSVAKDHLRERLVVVVAVSLVVTLIGSVLALHFERNGQGTDIHSYGTALFWTATQMLTISSQMSNPVTTAGRVLDVFLEAYAITVVATLAGSFGAFFHGRTKERMKAAGEDGSAGG